MRILDACESAQRETIRDDAKWLLVQMGPELRDTPDDSDAFFFGRLKIYLFFWECST